MADKTKIEWTESTWNPITGCTMVSAGCTNCYAMGLAATRLRHHPSREGLTRMTGGQARWTGEVRFNKQWLDQPLRWRKPRMIFVCAHGDLFHEAVPDEWIDRVFAVMALAPQHTFQVLTKRPEQARKYLAKVDERGRPQYWTTASLMAATGSWNTGEISASQWPLPNVWIGTSVEDQATADARIPHLLATPAAVRFVSAEPLLGPISFRWAKWDNWLDKAGNRRPAVNAYDGLRMLDWVICGGESGQNARPMHPDWARSLRDQCKAAGTAFFFKQMSKRADIPSDLKIREFPNER